MPIQQFLDDLRLRLDRQHLPSSYADRVLGELADHLYALRDEAIDSGEARDEADAEEMAQKRLAVDAEALADAFTHPATAPGRSHCISRRIWTAALTLATRHALSAFGLLPILLMLGIGYGCKFAGVFTYRLFVDRLDIDHMHSLFRAIVHYTFYGFAYATTPVLALFFCVLAHRAGRSSVLALVACALLSLGGGMLKLDLVQCTLSHSVAYFQRYGPEPTRLCLPMIVFAGYTCFRAVWAMRSDDAGGTMQPQ